MGFAATFVHYTQSGTARHYDVADNRGMASPTVCQVRPVCP